MTAIEKNQWDQLQNFCVYLENNRKEYLEWTESQNWSNRTKKNAAEGGVIWIFSAEKKFHYKAKKLTEETTNGYAQILLMCQKWCGQNFFQMLWFKMSFIMKNIS